jgi:CheY-like chemotaxis protein
LLVEDEALIAMHEKLVLERFGYDVVLALSGEKAIAVFNADPTIDLVLMDIDLGASTAPKRRAACSRPATSLIS